MVKVCMILYTPRSGSNNVCKNLYNFEEKQIDIYWELFNNKTTHGSDLQNLLTKNMEKTMMFLLKK